MLPHLILQYRDYFMIVETVMMPLGVMVLVIYLGLVALKKLPRRGGHPLGRIGGGMMMTSVASQVIVVSAEGDIYMTGLAFVTFCYITYTFMFRLARR